MRRGVEAMEEGVVYAAEVRRVPRVAPLEQQVPVQEVGQLDVAHRAADEQCGEGGLVRRQRQGGLVLQRLDQVRVRVRVGDIGLGLGLGI